MGEALMAHNFFRMCGFSIMVLGILQLRQLRRGRKFRSIPRCTTLHIGKDMQHSCWATISLCLVASWRMVHLSVTWSDCQWKALMILPRTNHSGRLYLSL